MAKTTTAAIFTGECRHALDDKNRVTIPARWRGEESTEVFVIKNPKQPCLTVMKPEIFLSLGDNAKSRLDPGRLQNFMRQLNSQAQQTTVDRQGRLLLVEEHCKQAGLRGEVVLVGVFDRFEIWSQANWKAFRETEKDSYEETAELVGI